MMASRVGTATGLVFICLHLSAFTTAQTVEWQIEDDTDLVLEGSDVTITCVGLNLNSISAVSMRRYVDGSSYTIGFNNVLLDPFASLRTRDGRQRYEIHYDILEDAGTVPLTYTGTLELTIRDVQGEDSSLLACIVDSDVAETSYRSFDVEVPITEVYISQMLPNTSVIPVAPGSTIHMIQMQLGGFACNAKVVGSTNLPEINAYVDDIVLAENVTENLTETNTARTGQYGMFDYERIVTLSRFTLNHDYRLNGATLRCEGYTRGFPDQKMTATANLELEFRAMIHCQKFAHYADVGEQVTFTCSVLANPAPEIYIEFGVNGDENDHMFNLEIYEDGVFKYEKENNNDNTTVMFTIKSVTAEHFTYKYRFTAFNEYNDDDPDVKKMELYQGEDPNDGTSSSSQVAAGVSVMLVTLILFLCL